MQIFVVQLDMQWQDPPGNHQRVAAMLADADVPAGALIVLPEMFDTGFSMDLGATAQDSSRRSEALLRELAAQYDAAVLGGVVGPIVDGKASNEAVAFGPDGQELVRYRKMQPFSLAGEDAKYGAGDGHRIFNWGGAQIAPFICYDLRFPEIFRPAALDGAELFVVIACWPETRSEHWVRLLQARAIENQAIVVGVNRCGQDPHLSYDGRSAGFDCSGIALFELDAAQQTATVEIDPAQVRLWREQFPALRDIRPEAIGRS